MVPDIKQGDIDTIVDLMQQLPEFDKPYNKEKITKKIDDKPYLNLVAYTGNIPVGFKLGYERDGYFYSWLGGVLPKYRRQGIAKKLAEAQEKWALENGYNAITFKTRNRHKAMLIFALKNGFDIIGHEKKDELAEHRIWLQKFIT